MAYEYEIKIPMWLEDGRWLNMNVDDEVLEELEEVYRKAKAFDEIYKFLSNSPIKPFFKEYLERMANELERADDER